MTLLDIAALLAAGCGAGFMAGLLGIGGGIVMVPVLLFFRAALGLPEDMAMHMALGTSLATVVPISITSALSHYRRGNVDMAMVRRWWVFVALGAVVGGVAVRWFDNRTLEILFAGLLIVAAANLFRSRPFVFWAQIPTGALWHRWIPAVIGGVAAMFGIGGGTFNVPYMCAMSIPIKRAIGTAAMFGVVLSIPGTVGFMATGLTTTGLPPWSVGFVHGVGFGILAPAAIACAPLGARVTDLLPDRFLRGIFAIFVAVVAFRLIF